MIDVKTQYHIPNENIYQMLCYIFDELEEETIGAIEQQSYTNLAELLSELLLRSTYRQLRSGLFRDYVSFSEPLSRAKGKIDMNRSIKLKTQLSRQLYCDYDEFSTDNMYNQIIKSTLLFIIRQGRVGAPMRKRIKDLLFSFHDISELKLRSVAWEGIRFHKDKFAYRTLIGLCYLLYKGLEEDEENERIFFKEKELIHLYEKFLRHFYMKENPKLHISYQRKQRSNEVEENDSERSFLVDMTLRYKKHKMIVSSHYFTEMLVRSEDNKSFILEQVSRLFISVKRSKMDKVSAAFIYPSVTEHYFDTYPIEGYAICVGAIDFTLPFEHIRQQLLLISQMVMEE